MTMRQRSGPPPTPTIGRTTRAVGGDELDAGYTLIELILVVLILGVLAAVVLLSVGGVSTEASETGCQTDQRQLGTAIESYFAEVGGDVIPATGAGHDQYENTLVSSGLLRSASDFYDVGADGALTPEADSRC